MSPSERRLVALAALFAPSAAGPLLRRLADPSADELAGAATHLATRPRAERLAALAEGLARGRSPEEARGLLASAIGAERAAVARVLRDRIAPELRPLAPTPRPPPLPSSGMLRRACGELVSTLVEP